MRICPCLTDCALNSAACVSNQLYIELAEQGESQRLFVIMPVTGGASACVINTAIDRGGAGPDLLLNGF
jgi:hypothetical protein